MSYDTHDILDIISIYSTDQVVDLLQKNNLSACCEAVVRRQVDGATLLHLTERDLIQWKLDLTKPLRWRLCQFVEDLNLNPGLYFAEENRSISPLSESDARIDDSDADAWSTDWEGDEDPSTTQREDPYDSPEMNIRTNSHAGSLSSVGNSRKISPNLMKREEENESIYANGAEIERNPSLDHGSDDRFTVIGRRIKKELEQGQRQNRPDVPNQPPTLRTDNRPIVGPKPVLPTQPTCIPPGPKRRPGSPISKINHDQTPKTVSQVRHPKNPGSIILPKPPRTQPEFSSSDEDDRPTSNGPNRTANKPRHPVREPTLTISETDTSTYVEPKRPTPKLPHHPRPGGPDILQPSERKTKTLPRPLPDPPSEDTTISRQLLGGLGSRLADEVADMIVRIKRGLLGCCRAHSSECPEPLEPPEPPERLPTTLPLTKYQPLSRPLPLTPSDRRPERSVEPPGRNFDVPLSYMDQPWFHNVGRDQATALVKGGTSKFSTTPPNGYFLVRPSNASPTQPWTLVLWYKTKVYNIPVRQRPDSRFALGSVKQKEQSFAAIEDLINFCKREEIPLTSATGEQVGLTRLTESPPKKRD